MTAPLCGRALPWLLAPLWLLLGMLLPQDLNETPVPAAPPLATPRAPSHGSHVTFALITPHSRLRSSPLLNRRPSPDDHWLSPPQRRAQVQSGRTPRRTSLCQQDERHPGCREPGADVAVPLGIGPSRLHPSTAQGSPQASPPDDQACWVPKGRDPASCETGRKATPTPEPPPPPHPPHILALPCPASRPAGVPSESNFEVEVRSLGPQLQDSGGGRGSGDAGPEGGLDPVLLEPAAHEDASWRG